MESSGEVDSYADVKNAITKGLEIYTGLCPYIGLKNIVARIENDDPDMYAKLCTEIEKLDVRGENVHVELISLIVDYALASDIGSLKGAGMGNSSERYHPFMDEKELDTELTGVFEEFDDVMEP